MAGVRLYTEGKVRIAKVITWPVAQCHSLPRS